MCGRESEKQSRNFSMLNSSSACVEERERVCEKTEGGGERGGGAARGGGVLDWCHLGTQQNLVYLQSGVYLKTSNT